MNGTHNIIPSFRLLYIHLPSCKTAFFRCLMNRMSNSFLLSPRGCHPSKHKSLYYYYGDGDRALRVLYAMQTVDLLINCVFRRAKEMCAYFASTLILPFGFAEQYCIVDMRTVEDKMKCACYAGFTLIGNSQ